MGSPLGPLMADTFMCSTKDWLQDQGKLPEFYKHYVDDDTLSIMPNVKIWEPFLSVVNEIHPSVSFTLELGEHGNFSFLGMEIRKCNGRLETTVYREPTDSRLLLHYKSHIDVRYKKSLLKTMLDRAFKVSSTWQLFHLECDHLTQMFSWLQYPSQLLQSTISYFVTKKVSGEPNSTQACNVNEVPVKVVLPFKDQRSANWVRRQLGELGCKIGMIFAPCIQALRSDTRSNQKKRSRLSLTSNMLTTNVVCAMQSLSGIRANTSISVLRNTRDRLQLGIKLKSNMPQSQVTYNIVILRS